MLKEHPWRDTLAAACWAEIDDQDNEAGAISGRRAAHSGLCRRRWTVAKMASRREAGYGHLGTT
jgi:hypothetical protein